MIIRVTKRNPQSELPEGWIMQYRTLLQSLSKRHKTDPEAKKAIGALRSLAREVAARNRGDAWLPEPNAQGYYPIIDNVPYALLRTAVRANTKSSRRRSIWKELRSQAHSYRPPEPRSTLTRQQQQHLMAHAEVAFPKTKGRDPELLGRIVPGQLRRNRSYIKLDEIDPGEWASGGFSPLAFSQQYAKPIRVKVRVRKPVNELARKLRFKSMSAGMQPKTARTVIGAATSAATLNNLAVTGSFVHGNVQGAKKVKKGERKKTGKAFHTAAALSGAAGVGILGAVAARHGYILRRKSAPLITRRRVLGATVGGAVLGAGAGYLLSKLTHHAGREIGAAGRRQAARRANAQAKREATYSHPNGPVLTYAGLDVMAYEDGWREGLARRWREFKWNTKQRWNRGPKKVLRKVLPEASHAFVKGSLQSINQDTGLLPNLQLDYEPLKRISFDPRLQGFTNNQLQSLLGKVQHDLGSRIDPEVKKALWRRAADMQAELMARNDARFEKPKATKLWPAPIAKSFN